MAKTDPRIIKTLRQIDAALLENLRQRPFQKITIDMICTSALINRSTFYKYYTDKGDLLNNYLDRVLAEFRKAVGTTDFILATPATIDDQRYEDNFRRSIEFIYAHRTTYTALWEAAIERKVYDEMIHAIHQNILDKLPTRTGDNKNYAQLYAYLFASNMMNLVSWWFKNERTVTANDVCRLMKSNMKNGMFATFKHVF